MHTSFSKWLKQALPSIFAIMIMLLPLSNPVHASTYSDNQSSIVFSEPVGYKQSEETNQFTEYQLRYTPSRGFFDVSAFLDVTNPELNKCSFFVKDTEYPFSEAITHVSAESGVDPRVILTLLDVRFGIFDVNPNTICDAMRNWSEDLLILATHMMDSTAVFGFGEDGSIQVTDFARSQLPFSGNAAEFSVAEAAGWIAKQVNKSPDLFLNDFYTTYYDYFQKEDTTIDSLDGITAQAEIIFKLPFTGRHTYSGGPHDRPPSKICNSKKTNASTTSGLDFAGSDKAYNGFLDESILAIADGMIVGIKETETVPGKYVAIRHSGGLYSSNNDIVSIYYHMSDINDSLRVNQYINVGAYLGERGETGCPNCTGPHIHLELRHADGINYSNYPGGIGTPVSWNGMLIDNYLINSVYFLTREAVNYDGTAIYMKYPTPTKEKLINIDGGCGEGEAIVEEDFPHTGETNWGNTYFAQENNTSMLYSTITPYCPGAQINKDIISQHETANGNLTNGVCDSDTSEKTPPTASFISPKNGDEINTTTLAVRANASDNAGGSGIKQVNFSAKWSGDWYSIGSDTTAPYETNYDLCTRNVPKGDIELGLEAIDNAGNKYVYSSNHSNPVVRYNGVCTGGGVPSGYWSKNIWPNEKMEFDATVHTTLNSFFIDENWRDGPPHPNIGADKFSISYAQNIVFEGGHYEFRIKSDDGSRILIDGVRRWGEWEPKHVDAGFGVDLSSGNHTIQVDYFENTGDARIKVWFWGPGIGRIDVNEPEGRITSFTNNSYIGQSPITITADAWDEESGIQSVKFRVHHCQGGCGWRDISTDTSAPYSATWNHSGMEGQQVKFTLDVTDKSGKTKTNAGGEITATIDSANPSISIVSPVAESPLFEKSFNIAVSASDALSGIQRVKFQAGYPGDENYWHVLGEDTDGSNGWGLLWDGSSLPDGTHVDFYVEAVDNAGNIASDVIRAVRIGASVIFYEDVGYGGRSTSFFQKTASDLSYIIDNNASSIKIKPGWSIRVFEGNRIRGGWKCYQSDVSDLSYEIYPNNSVGINDTISSVEVYPRATCPGPADANWDGIIDGIDYTIWHLNYTSTNTMGSSTADYNYDGIVDGIDYTIWHINY